METPTINSHHGCSTSPLMALLVGTTACYNASSPSSQPTITPSRHSTPIKVIQSRVRKTPASPHEAPGQHTYSTPSNPSSPSTGIVPPNQPRITSPRRNKTQGNRPFPLAWGRCIHTCEEQPFFFFRLPLTFCRLLLKVLHLTDFWIHIEEG